MSFFWSSSYIEVHNVMLRIHPFFELLYLKSKYINHKLGWSSNSCTFGRAKNHQLPFTGLSELELGLVTHPG
jgi:hypothetical protein